MSTMTNISSRRLDTIGYNVLLSRKEALEAKQIAEKEAEQQTTRANAKVTSQANMNALCKDLHKGFTDMVNKGKEIKQHEIELKQKTEEEKLFYATADINYQHKEVDESISGKMSLLRAAYYILPGLDCIFAFFAILPIVTNAFGDLSHEFQVGAGIVAALALGLGLSLVSRFGVASLDGGNNSDNRAGLKKFAVRASMFVLPSMYLISELAFNGGERWAYSAGFAFVSIVIQSLMVSGYEKQQEARAYFADRKRSEAIRLVKEKDENAIHQEIFSIREKIESIISSFQLDYNTFVDKFRALAISRREHIREFEADPEIYLSQTIIFFGDLIVFRREEIPLDRTDGLVSVLAPYEFPGVSGIQALYENDDFDNLDHIMKTIPGSISLSATIKAIEDQRKRIQDKTSAPKTLEEPTSTENELDPWNDGDEII